MQRIAICACHTIKAMVKYLLSSLIVTLLVLVSCEKDENTIPDGEDYGCIQRVYVKAKDHTISGADVAIVDNLFSKNKIDYSIFRYYEFRHDTIQDSYPPYTKRDRKWVRVDQYSRDLRIFNAERVFAFYNDTLPEPDFYQRTLGPYTPQLDTTPNLSLPRVRRLFAYNLDRHLPLDSNSVRINYSDTCFSAEFGFYKEIVDKHETIKFHKAWRVFKKNSKNDRPVGYYDDETGKQIAFSQ
ncbi:MULTISPECIES: hypothetical protein [Niastella]|uniref:DKNYY family protein n=1 Tax=Niastella soli TaxID=2821487 RepID=A0ABS3YPE0_9BACT|nr:hypothetical protein [Niastella soli]MBO9199467.1 hypothetical protein [Niastella soli]